MVEPAEPPRFVSASVATQRLRPAHPAAPPRWEGHAPDPLTQQALTALAAQDAATHDQHLRLLRFDDRMAELVSCRWVVQGVRRDRGDA